MRHIVEFYVEVRGYETSPDLDKIQKEVEQLLDKHFDACIVKVEMIS